MSGVPVLGRFLYRTATFFAVIIAIWAILNYVHSISLGVPRFPIAPWVLAGAIWLIGWCCRYFLAG
jgi:hypothetical protein